MSFVLVVSYDFSDWKDFLEHQVNNTDYYVIVGTHSVRRQFRLPFSTARLPEDIPRAGV
jgi:hypothetical protein